MDLCYVLLLVEAEKYIRALTTIREVSRVVSNFMDVELVCKYAVEKLKEMVPAISDCGIALFEVNGGDIKVTVQCGVSEKDIDKARLFSDFAEIGKARDIQIKVEQGKQPVSASVIWVPLSFKDRIIGLMQIKTKEEITLSEEDQKFIKDFADEISIALQRTIMFERIKSQADHDKLTGLLNRRKLDEDLPTIVKRGEIFSILMIDVDWFKKYNDRWGHLQGDMCLKKVAEILKNSCRGYDLIYRYGGEEFTVISRGVEGEDAFKLGERLRKKILKTEFAGEEKSQPKGEITISVGIASFPLHGKSGSEVLKAADKALYHAKEKGRNVTVMAEHSTKTPEKT